MSQRHALDAPRHIIERGPQCLNDLPIHLLSPRDIARRKAGQARILVSMDVKQPDASAEFERFGYEEFRAFGHPLLKIVTT